MKAQHAATRAAETLTKNTSQSAAQPAKAPETAYEALDRAAAAIESKKAGVSPDRDALIKNAMNIHKNKQDVLSELSQEERDKLMGLALKLMEGGKG